MPFNSVIDRTDAGGLIPEPEVVKVIDAAVAQSAALRLFDRVPMSKQTDRISVQSALPIAYWVAGDTGLKQTTEAAWAKKDLVAEELAAIVPIPENVLDDASYDVWARIRPQMAAAVGRALDAAIFFGVNKPASFPTDIVAGAVAAGNMVTRGTATAAAGGLAQDLSNVFAAVEADGYDVNGIVAKRTMRGLLRGVRDTTGQRLLDVSNNEIEGVQIAYVMDGLWPTGATPPGLYAELIAGDFTQGILGVRQDVTYKLITEGVITDAGGLIIFNLPQQDMVALRIKARFAFQIANPINYQEAGANRYPWAVLRSPAA
jgi:HK97 family phage major capsid protein